MTSSNTSKQSALVILGEFRDYEGFRRALAAAREHRDISFECLEELAGAPKGYFSKVLGPSQTERIGVKSLAWIIGALGVKCLIVDDPEAFARLKHRMRPRRRMPILKKRSAVKKARKKPFNGHGNGAFPGR